MPACRFCPKYAKDHEVVKYSTRHYAHFACYLDHKPLSDLEKWQIERFPVRLLKERGLMDEAERLTCDPV